MTTLHLQPDLFKRGADATTAQVDGSRPGHPWTALSLSPVTYALGGLWVPTGLVGSVTFRVGVTPVTAAAGKKVQLRFDHKPVANGEATDVSAAWSSKNSGDISLDDTQGDLTSTTWTETVTNLGWVAGDWVPFRLYRTNASADELSGDLIIVNFKVEIPVPVTYSVVAKTTDYTATTSDDVIEVDCTAGDVTISLYAIASNTGRELHVRRIDGSAYTVILDGDGETVDGAATMDLNFQYDSAHLYVGTTEWGLL